MPQLPRLIATIQVEIDSGKLWRSKKHFIILKNHLLDRERGRRASGIPSPDFWRRRCSADARGRCRPGVDLMEPVSAVIFKSNSIAVKSKFTNLGFVVFSAIESNT
jgi:hypothetical protein